MHFRDGFESYGKFWLDTHNHYSDGFLSIKDNNIELILFDSSNAPIFLDDKVPFIYGWTEHNNLLILSELQLTEKSGSMSCFRRFNEYTEISMTKYKFIVCKGFFIDKNPIDFLRNSSSENIDLSKELATEKISKSNNLTFYIDHSDKWMCMDIPKIMPNYNEDRNISFYEIHGISNFTLELDNGIKLRIIIEDIIRGTVKFELIDSYNKFNIEELIELSKKIVYLMQFSLNNKVRMHGMSTRIDNIFTIHIHDSYIPCYNGKFKDGRILFDKRVFEITESSMEDFFNNWIKKFDLFLIPLQIYLNHSSTHRFFDLYRSIESLVESLFGEKLFKDKLNEFCNFPKEILDLDDRYEEIYKQIVSSKGRIKKIRDSFTHGHRKSMGSISDQDIINEKTYNKLMEYIFILNILKALGLNNDDIKLVANSMYPNNMKYRIHSIII